VTVSLDNIPRVDRPSDAELVEKYLATATPVVVRGLYDTSRVGAIKTIDDAVAAWGTIPVPIQLEYTTRSLIRDVEKQIQIVPFGDFVRRTDDEARYWIVGEQPVEDIPQLAGWIDLPSVVDQPGTERADVVNKMFVAHRGHWAHAHYDLDGKPVLLTQVFGRKRVVLAPPDRGQLFDPIPAVYGHWSSLFVENMSDGEKLDLVRRIGAYDTILYPGDTVFIPTAWWHYVDYLDTGMGFNVRLGRTSYQKRLYEIAIALQAKHLHYWQGIAQVFATGRTPEPEMCALADRVLALFDRARETGESADASRFGDALIEIYRKAQPDGYARVLSANDLTRREPIDALAPVEAEPGAEATPVFTATSQVRLAGNTEIAETLAAERRELLVLVDNAMTFRIEATSDPDAYRAARAVLEALSANGREAMTVADLAARTAIAIDELVDLLGELGEAQTVVAA
jgi:hypothetical protein